jgi:hypothetical protein
LLDLQVQEFTLAQTVWNSNSKHGMQPRPNLIT